MTDDRRDRKKHQPLCKNQQDAHRLPKDVLFWRVPPVPGALWGHLGKVAAPVAGGGDGVQQALQTVSLGEAAALWHPLAAPLPQLRLLGRLDPHRLQLLEILRCFRYCIAFPFRALFIFGE